MKAASKIVILPMLALVYSLWAKPIQTSEAIPIGGIRQWISIRSVSDTLPVLLFLHGGPGNSVMSFAEKFTKTLQQHFVVVQWDQRESGKTAKINPSPQPLSVSIMASDASEVINYLRGRFSEQKIYLVGHSWGGFLALRVAALHPEWLSACIAVAPMVNQWESERQTLGWLMEKAKSESNQEAIVELSQVNIPFRTPDELYFHRRWLLLADRKNPFPHNYVRKWGEKWFGLYKEACGINLFEAEPELQCPVYFFLGSSDRQASSSISEAYYNALKAEKKGLFWFTKSGHSLNLTEPNLFQATILGLRTR